jgi:hypothetical protein
MIKFLAYLKVETEQLNKGYKIFKFPNFDNSKGEIQNKRGVWIIVQTPPLSSLNAFLYFKNPSSSSLGLVACCCTPVESVTI